MSPLQQAIDEYLSLRRSLGFKLRDETSYLSQFAHFLELQGADFITTDLAVQWATQPDHCSPAYATKRLGMIRLFAQHHAPMDPRTEVPPQGLLPSHYHRKQPYIYQAEEIQRLIDATGGLGSSIGLRPLTYYTVFGLLAATGMRMREATVLDRRDVDLKHGILTVRHSKFNKSRLLPVHASTQQKFEKYSAARFRLLPRTRETAFFLSDSGRRLTPSTVRWTFVKLSRRIGFRGPQDSHGPRLHDLRHTFAVNTLLRWYRTGQDTERRLPELATYLGHRHVKDTYWYLTAVPELLQLAAMKLYCPKEDYPHDKI